MERMETSNSSALKVYTPRLPAPRVLTSASSISCHKVTSGTPFPRPYNGVSPISCYLMRRRTHLTLHQESHGVRGGRHPTAINHLSFHLNLILIGKHYLLRVQQPSVYSGSQNIGIGYSLSAIIIGSDCQFIPVVLYFFQATAPQLGKMLLQSSRNPSRCRDER